MMKKKVIIILAILLLLCGSMNAYPVKNSFCACFFSSLGNSGLPGTFGWGHLYAGDWKGFLIFQIGGSACSLIAVKSLSSWAASSNPDAQPALLGTGLIALAGTGAFSIMNFITGLKAADKYNTNMWDRYHRLALEIQPTRDNNTKLGISYKM